MRRRLLWCGLVGWLQGSRLIRRCIWRTGRGIVVILLVRLVNIAVYVMIRIYRG